MTYVGLLETGCPTEIAFRYHSLLGRICHSFTHSNELIQTLLHAGPVLDLGI